MGCSFRFHHKHIRSAFMALSFEPHLIQGHNSEALVCLFLAHIVTERSQNNLGHVHLHISLTLAMELQPPSFFLLRFPHPIRDLCWLLYADQAEFPFRTFLSCIMIYLVRYAHTAYSASRLASLEPLQSVLVQPWLISSNPRDESVQLSRQKQHKHTHTHTHTYIHSIESSCFPLPRDASWCAEREN
jgi:hypothetical protein